MAFTFHCPHCKQYMSVDPEAAGKHAQCPKCSRTLTIPSVSTPAISEQAPDEAIFCPKCGQMNFENNFRCTACDFMLHGSRRPQYAVADEGTLGVVIPYKNPQALWAYYLAVSSLIPFMGIPLGIAAVVLGIRGLEYAKVHPESKGKVHAWAGIALGLLCATGYTLLIVVPLIMGLIK